MSKGSTSKTLVWILMAMLIFGLGGFGITNLGGTVRSVGTVGDKEIDITAYSRALQEELRALEAQTGQSISFADAQAAGIDRLVLGGLVTRRAMDAENDRMGISLGDERLRDELTAIPSFKNADGSFNREAYRYAMEQTGLSEAAFEDSIREDSTRSLLQAAIVSGIAMPDSFGAAIMGFVGEQRDVTLARIGAGDLAYPVATPTDADLHTYYDANLAQFTRPATRDITYVWLTPDMLIDSVDVDEEALKDLYAERDAEFNTPERRLVERLAFADMAAAQDALSRLNRGAITFEGLVSERGLELGDIDMGDVAASELGDAGDIVFKTGAGLIAGPAQSDLGPALFRVNGVLPGQTTSYEEARPVLREDLAAERARRVIDAQVGDIDDLLAAGATLEDLAKETDMQVGQISWHANVHDAIAGYDAFRAIAPLLDTSDFPQIENLEDGGIFALRLNGETPAAPAPFDQVQDDVIAAWTQAETLTRLQTMADALVPQLAGDADFAAFALTPRAETKVQRGRFVAETPAAFLDTVFATTPGEVTTLVDKDGIMILRVDTIYATDFEAPEIAAGRDTVLQQAASGLSQDIFEAYAAELQLMHPVTLNQAALNAVHAQFQ